jgi:S-DNA-T family DNA segregation ATPase FtsK/SpoIIIE
MPGIPLPRLLNSAREIAREIEVLAGCERLWIDTETCNNNLSLIQVLAGNAAPAASDAIVLDVLDQPETIRLFIDRIMVRPSIEKVFHNAGFDVSRLGGDSASNVFCTLRHARDLRRRGCALLPSGLSLKELTEHFGIAEDVFKGEQAGDWGRRPLTERQLQYAAMDVVFLRGVHLRLLDFNDTI